MTLCTLEPKKNRINNKTKISIFQSLQTNYKEYDSKDLLLIFDFTMFRNEISKSGMDEMSVHKQILDSKEKELLKHPLAEAFLYLKWRRHRMFFYSNFAFYCLFAFSFTVFALSATNAVKVRDNSIIKTRLG